MSETDRDKTEARETSGVIRLLRSAALYITLVGLPLAGLLIILHQGKALVPPPTIGGEWTLPSDVEQLSCLGLDPENAMMIEQSGRYLRVHVGSVVSAGRIHEGLVSAQFQSPSGHCAGLDATLEASKVDERLVITLRAPDCNACADVTFDAQRPSPRTL